MLQQCATTKHSYYTDSTIAVSREVMVWVVAVPSAGSVMMMIDAQSDTTADNRVRDIVAVRSKLWRSP